MRVTAVAAETELLKNPIMHFRIKRYHWYQLELESAKIVTPEGEVCGEIRPFVLITRPLRKFTHDVLDSGLHGRWNQLLPSFLYGLMVYGLFCPMYLNTKAAIEFIRSNVLPFFPSPLLS